MCAKFVRPIFVGKCLELRYQEGEVCVYGTSEGLTRLSKLIMSLVAKPRHGHIHLEDYDVLTDASLTGVVAIFDEDA